MKNVEIPKWLERLPLAPEFRPTDTEFADPIAYISKIEKEASAFGICKVIPPLPKPSRKYVLHNLNKSLAKCPELDVDVNLVSSSKTDGGGRNNCDRNVSGGEYRAVFTTRQQELGCEKVKKVKEVVGDQVFGAQKQVWQSGEVYTLEQFEAKAKNFAKTTLGIVKDINPLLIETMFWKAASEKPIYVEYANDVPGSGFSTAGWKLSNSPWNLQVMARSAGSLTRFMPDDIPGVTSPMVYIGMLFSWFAWHVEDHELHSLNFLHMGSPKTWYSVPGDYAFNFEEAIRRHAYGGNPDRSVALSLLGEKTTVLSPEIIVASGIPCCRLVQYPGEFVVTFPRAYHIGFSHGFNCGEAANFGTSKWLTIAKEAAVRRAAMNYLPMLSHQQLLYLLTMSFISRIPRSLLPGVRSSRLRDRQKEERELSVKRAFIEDILRENSRLTVLLQRNSCYHAVLWDVDSLPSSSKDSDLCQDADASVLTSAGENSPGKDDNAHDLNELNKYISAVGYDLDDDDLAYDFQIESGTLPCVACGILGFPFMAVMQPSEALANFSNMVEGCTEDAKDKSKSSKKDEASLAAGKSQSTHSPVEKSSVPDHSPSSNREAASPKVKIAVGWDISNQSLKPRIFCLEHAIEIEELLSSRGGANVLVICHSDFQKIKTHAAVIAEEIAVPFSYTEILLGNASPEDLKLIDVAIDREEHAACVEDWTSLLNINLQHCVRMKRSSPSANVQHLLSLGGLFCDAAPISDTSSTKWLSRKLRSKRHQKRLLQSKPSNGNGTAKEDMNMKKEHQTSKKDIKIIQYSRKRYKVRASAGTHTPGGTNNLVVRDIPDPGEPEKEDKNITGSTVRVEIDGKRFLGPTMSPVDGMLEFQCEHPMASSSRGFVENASESHSTNSIIDSTLIENVEAQTRICPVDKFGGSCHDVTAADEGCQKSERYYSETVGSTTDKNGMEDVVENGIVREEEIVNEASVEREACDRLAENDCAMSDSVHSDGCCEIKEASRHDDSSNSSDDYVSSPRCDEQMEEISDQLVKDSEVSKSSSSEAQQHVQTDGDDDQERVISSCAVLGNGSTSALIDENRVDETNVAVGSHDDNVKTVVSLENVLDDSETMAKSRSNPKAGSRRKRELLGLQLEGQFHVNGFIRSPCEGLRPRAREDSSACITDNRELADEAPTPTVKKSRKAADQPLPRKDKKENPKGHYKCQLDGCTMSFRTKAELHLHKRNQCPVDGCRKKFNSHKYAIQHQRVHDDDRPLKCPWDGCTMSFKWAWARTEHLRVHTGERPYACKIKGCGLTFRFVSDFSRHRRKTGHYVTPPA
ncbi:Zinc finger family protein / transcription factor jumonji family protein [Perilla frutescens var. hirtella]|uniref:Zinc finger family protein / transcription factor jumonji family protein n=1 Tax=Perilla frutescens var. hirtella TaxID=608512 RepID=A0AAD4P664_PERFH|nr:Zinc finger family protein / transcription factor jumonji family protein [Perilla frutescens var. hirtella]